MSVAPTAFAAQPQKDSQEVSGLLSDVKSEAVQLRNDTEEMKSFTMSKLTWQSHAAKITEIKGHVNNAGELLMKLNNARGSASPWQQDAIDRITPLLKDMAASVTSTIEHLAKNPGRLQTAPYKDYVTANDELASDLAKLISDYVDYDKTAKGRADELGP
jgi:hypothetical protein